MKPVVYVTRMLPSKALSLLIDKFDVEVWPDYAPPSKSELKEKAENADALITMLTDKLDREIFHNAFKLKIVAQMAVGYDNINLPEATKKGIYITNTPDVLTEATADFAWTLLMALARRMVEADRYVREGKWTVAWHPDLMTGHDVYGSTIGIIGAGRIGQAVAQRARGFNMKILYYNPSAKLEMDSIGALGVSLDDLLKQSDFVSLHVPLTTQTTHLINEEKLSLMKNSAYLINTSRGAVVDEKALYAALKNGKIAGAGLDVFENEPTSYNNPLLKLDNVVVAPHISSASVETRTKMAELAVQNLLSFFKGKKPPNLINAEVLKINPLMNYIS